MISKFLRPCHKLRHVALLCPRVLNRPTIRVAGHLIPVDQYQQPPPAKLKLGYTLYVHWEVWPLVIIMVVTISLVFAAITWAINNKVDIVFKTNCRDSISRTMDLRNPSIHKVVIINQEYPPWPEMANVLEKMVAAEKRAISRAKSCNHP